MISHTLFLTYYLSFLILLIASSSVTSHTQFKRRVCIRRCPVAIFSEPVLDPTLYLFIYLRSMWLEYRVCPPPPTPKPVTSGGWGWGGTGTEIYISPTFFYLFYSAINTIFIKYEVPWAGRATIFLRLSDNATIGQLIKAYGTPLNSKAFAPRIQNLVST